MVNSCFRVELDSYEEMLTQWAKFTVKTCRKIVTPNRLEIEGDGSLWLVHLVRDTDQAIKCKDGKAVRLLKLGLGNSVECTVH